MDTVEKDNKQLDTNDAEEVAGGALSSISATRRDVLKYCPVCKKTRVFYVYSGSSYVCSTCGNTL